MNLASRDVLSGHILTVAQAYHAFGWSVFPISEDKKPLVNWKLLQTQMAHPGGLPVWFDNPTSRQFRNSRIAIACGQFSGIYVVDADNQEAIDELLALGMPETPTVRTKRGQHWYFRFNPERSLRNSDHMGISGKIDARGEGGLVVAPPTEARSWIVGPCDVPLAPIPEAIYRLVDARRTQKNGLKKSTSLPLKAQGTVSSLKPTASLITITGPTSLPPIDGLDAKTQDRVDQVAAVVAQYTDLRHNLYLHLNGELFLIGANESGRYDSAVIDSDYIEMFVKSVQRKAHPYWEKDVGTKSTFAYIDQQIGLIRGLRRDYPDVWFAVREAFRLPRTPTPVDSIEQAVSDAKAWLFDILTRRAEVEKEKERRQRAVDLAQAALTQAITKGEDALHRDDHADYNAALEAVKRERAVLKLAEEENAKPIKAERTQNVFALSGETGFGKTYISCALAIFAAERGIKVAIATPSNERTIAMARENLLGKASFVRFFGTTSIVPEAEWNKKHVRLPLAERPPQSLTGVEACIHHAYAKHFTEGGQSVQRICCLGGAQNERVATEKGVICQAYGSCGVREGVEEVRMNGEEPMIAIGNYSTMDALLDWVGSEGILINDEPTGLVETIEIPFEHSQIAINHTADLTPNYTSLMYPLVRDIHAFQSTVEQMGRSLSEPILTTEFFEGLSTHVREALPKDWKGDAPPIQNNILASIKAPYGDTGPRLKLARAISITSRTYKTIFEIAEQAQNVMWKRATDPTMDPQEEDLLNKATLRYVPKDERPGSVVITRLASPIAKALARNTRFNAEKGIGGFTLILDANFRSNARIYEQFLGYAPDYRYYALKDAGVAHRTWIQGKVSRSKVLPRGRINVVVLARLLKKTVLAWIDQGTPELRYGFISFQQVILLIRRVQEMLGGVPDGDPPEAWRTREWGEIDALATELRLKLGDNFFRRIPMTGYFHNIRGNNAFQGMDGIITFGDPIPNVGSSIHEAEWLCLGRDFGDRLGEIRTEDELEQSHGRLRTSRRTLPSRSLHVGRGRPGGTGWGGTLDVIEFVDWDGGRPPTEGDMDAAEFRLAVDALGGVRRTVTWLGSIGIQISDRTVKRYMYEDSVIPQETASAIRRQLNGSGGFTQLR